MGTNASSDAERPVFIVGQARSGTSILYRLLLEHPRFAGRGEPNLSESNVLEVIAHQREIEESSTRAFAELDEAGWADLHHQLRWTDRRRRVAVRLPSRVLRNVGAWTILGGRRTLRCYLAEARRAKGVPRLVEKTPWHLTWVPHLRAAYPEAQLLSIVRDPVAVYASYRRRAQEDPDAASWAERSVDAFIASWAAEAALAERWSEQDPAFAVLDYEELVGRPERAQEVVFTWLGEPPMATLPGERPRHPGAPAADAAQLYGPIRDLGRSWQTYLDDDEAARVADALGPAADRLRARALNAVRPAPDPRAPSASG